jgi:hypothetical protein
MGVLCYIVGMENDIMYIYALVDPRDNKTRYVGVTKDPLNRFRSHLRVNQSVMRHGKKRCEWIAELREGRLAPKMIILEESDWDNWQKAEQWWIRHMRETGYDLLNVNNGGIGPNSISDETRASMRKSHLGVHTRPMSETHKKSLIASRRKLIPTQVSEIRVLLATRADLNTKEIGLMYNVHYGIINQIAYHRGYSEFTDGDGLQDAIDSKKRCNTHPQRRGDLVSHDVVREVRSLADKGIRIIKISEMVNIKYYTALSIIRRQTYKLVK